MDAYTCSPMTATNVPGFGSNTMETYTQDLHYSAGERKSSRIAPLARSAPTTRKGREEEGFLDSN